MPQTRTRFYSKIKWAGLLLTLSLALSLTAQSGALAVGEEHTAVDWNKLGLSEDQNKQIQELETDWEKHYAELKTTINEEQKRLVKLLGIHSSDPVEIMALQSSIARKREQLSAIAVATYLKKREVLTDNQQHTLELMMKQAFQQNHSSGYGTETEVMPDHIQGLMQRVRKIWPVQGEP
jgi:Spy/CpxP family protein refolding chaperone